jgi:ribosomal protein S18 acetylase RimI-like enzyme
VDSKLLIRQYQKSDKDAVWELHRIALEPTGAMLLGPWNDDFKNIPAHYPHKEGDFLVGLINEKIVCMGALRKKSENLGEIKRMRVHPYYQRMGYGQIILTSLEARARELGYMKLCLDTTTKQLPAQSFYMKNGYREVGRTFYAGLEIIFYEKKLG